MSSRAAVSVSTRPLWLLGLGARAVRVLLCAAALGGIAVTARDAVSPPQPARAQAPHVSLPDAGAEAFAVLFVRRYLTWDAGNPDAYQQGMSAFAGPAMPAGAGVTLPSTGTQHVQWSQVVQSRADVAGGHVYTVAAQTDTSGVLYLTVPVTRDSSGQLSLTGYPGFVGPPAVRAFVDRAAAYPDVADASLQQVASRALHNYLGGAGSNLAADLAPDARVSVPPLAFTFDHVSRLSWSPDGRSVNAELVAADSHGTDYTLGYELDVRRANSRWEISAIQMDPNA